MRKILIEDVFFVLLLGFIFLFIMPMHHGFSIGDDADYILCAAGHADRYSYFWNRLGTWVPISIAMKVFGYYGKNLTYVPTFCFLLFLSGVYAALRLWDRTIGLFAVAILGCTRFLLQNASTVNSDIMITIMANAPVLMYFAYTVHPDKDKSGMAKWWGGAAGILFVLASMTKESIAFYIPLFAVLAIGDFWIGRYKDFWIAMILVSITGIIGICTFYWYATGDFFRTYHLSALHFVIYSTPADPTYVEIIKRLTYQPFQFLLENYGFGSLLLFSSLNFL